ncbi:MAG: universal stress protein [Anaerolineae bacterium]|nr:universal stress protein [Anaerolineae bacterium]
MSLPEESARYLEAVRDFQRARQRGTLESIVALLTGRSDRLLSYGQVSEQLRTGAAIELGLQEIPLDAIVGSVGRYSDFTRSFLPRRESGQERWARVRAAFDRVEDIPPITVFQIGDSYFVLDGNHRVSVARSLDATHIPAYVTQVESRVPLRPDANQDELISQAQYAAFLEDTELDELRPGADLTVTAPGQYRVLREQIHQYHEWLRQQADSPVPFGDAVAGWYDVFYLPVVDVIRRRGILRHFPGRTETDLYVWIVRHQGELAEELGWEVATDLAANSVVYRYSDEPRKVWTRLRDRLLGAITPEPLSAGPPPGVWREQAVSERMELFLFSDILVPMAAGESGQRALAQALIVARREEARLHGLHVLSPESDAAHRRGEEIAATFAQKTEAASVAGEMTIEHGQVTRTICEHARWTDLVVMGLHHLPGSQPSRRLTSGLSTFIRRCGRPVLAVPGAPSPLQRPLLAYDGSPKAREALFVATYLSAKWELPLVVVTAGTDELDAEEVIDEARFYLIARGVSATYVTGQGPVTALIRDTAGTHPCDLIVMGGYGFRPLLEVVLGSTVDQVLHWRRWPALICR